MKRFTASIELDEEQTALLEATAAYFSMDMKTFLTAALESGIAHAEDMLLQSESSIPGDPDTGE